MNCISQAWRQHERALRRFLRDRAGSDAEGDDLLQELFLRALRRKNGLCGIDDPRAWLFATARRLLIDRYRLTKEQVPLPDDLVAQAEEPAPVEGLVECLPRVLGELSAHDREAIILCDIQGVTQQEYARRFGLSLPAAKSRVQRARARLKARMVQACRVQFDANGKVADFLPRS